jgi:hypothetical protein
VVTGRVAARTRVKAQLSSSGDVTATAVAVGNDQSTRMEGGYADIRAGQSHYGRGTKARVDARLLDVQGSASMTAAAAANQQGFYGSADGAWLHVDQTSTGQTRATVVGAVESGQTIGATAAAAANTISLANKGPQAELRAFQTHEGYVRGEAYLTAYAFGEASVTAVAAGNTISADLEGAELTLDTDQVNSGGVEADAAVFGGNGYAMTLSASAIGNAVSGSVCADCDGALMATNSQVNNGDVSAGARADVGGAVRSTANAMGNSAVYVVKAPTRTTRGRASATTRPGSPRGCDLRPEPAPGVCASWPPPKTESRCALPPCAFSPAPPSVALLTACASTGTQVPPAPSAAAPAAGADRPAAPAGGPAGQPAGAAWAHERSDLKPDPAVRFGRLPNGMRYAVARNATPEGEASLRLRIDAGSLMEKDDQQGLAHFMEHMIFNGTRNVPRRRVRAPARAAGPGVRAGHQRLHQLRPDRLHAGAAGNERRGGRHRAAADARSGGRGAAGAGGDRP